MSLFSLIGNMFERHPKWTSETILFVVVQPPPPPPPNPFAVPERVFLFDDFHVCFMTTMVYNSFVSDDALYCIWSEHTLFMLNFYAIQWFCYSPVEIVLFVFISLCGVPSFPQTSNTAKQVQSFRTFKQLQTFRMRNFHCYTNIGSFFRLWCACIWRITERKRKCFPFVSFERRHNCRRSNALIGCICLCAVPFIFSLQRSSRNIRKFVAFGASRFLNFVLLSLYFNRNVGFFRNNSGFRRFLKLDRYVCMMSSSSHTRANLMYVYNVRIWCDDDFSVAIGCCS